MLLLNCRASSSQCSKKTVQKNVAKDGILPLLCCDSFQQLKQHTLPRLIVDGQQRILHFLQQDPLGTFPLIARFVQLDIDECQVEAQGRIHGLTQANSNSPIRQRLQSDSFPLPDHGRRLTGVVSGTIFQADDEDPLHLGSVHHVLDVCENRLTSVIDSSPHKLQIIANLQQFVFLRERWI